MGHWAPVGISLQPTHMMYVRVRVSSKARVVHWDQRLYVSVQLRSLQCQRASELPEHRLKRQTPGPHSDPRNQHCWAGTCRLAPAAIGCRNPPDEKRWVGGSASEVRDLSIITQKAAEDFPLWSLG